MKLGLNSVVYPTAKICNPELVEIGNNVIVDDFVFIYLKNGIKIGNYVHIGVNSVITGGGQVNLESFSGLSSGVKLFTSTEFFDGDNLTNPTIPSQFRKVKTGPIVISKHAVICANSIIMPNVTIGEGSVIGAHSLVTKSVEPWGIYQGSPLKRIKSRNITRVLEMESELLNIREN